MPFKRYVEIGRVALINYGEEAGKLVTIVDVVDQNRVSLQAWPPAATCRNPAQPAQPEQGRVGSGCRGSGRCFSAAAAGPSHCASTAQELELAAGPGVSIAAAPSACWRPPGRRAAVSGAHTAAPGRCR